MSNILRKQLSTTYWIDLISDLLAGIPQYHSIILANTYDLTNWTTTSGDAIRPTFPKTALKARYIECFAWLKEQPNDLDDQKLYFIWLKVQLLLQGSLESSEVDILLHSTPKRAPNRLHEDFFGVMRISSQSNSASHILAHRLGLARCGLGLCFGLVKLCVKITLHIGARVPTPNAQCFTPGDTAEDQTTADQQSISETQETFKKKKKFHY